ncbi:hypothetical protein RhiirA5_438149 [Rhizophagus irregularis]|uniref:Uncharacterized protein n=1 Tax=Rhizophagus irregularis TaxID=588596 RepID=A0A2N0NJI0_9GLOM|nr:hypothetical protein RhiirA5_438149 [Rhizophagus irregularis]
MFRNSNICRIADNCELWICGYLDFKICNVLQYRKLQLFRNCLFAAPSLVIDKVLVNEKSEGSIKRLATESGEVKEAVDNDFASMFRKKNTLQNSLTPLWQQIYEPAGKFKEIMEATIEKVTMEKWNNTVKELNKNLTAGLSIEIQQTKDSGYERKLLGQMILITLPHGHITGFRFRMQKIVNIANDFYLINDIDINVKKSEIIIINPSVERHDQIIELGYDRSIVQDTNNEIRYLGV